MILSSAILRNSGFAALGTGLYSVSQFFILVILAQFGGPDLLGRYALTIAVTAPVFMFTNMRLRFVVATDVEARAPFAAYLTVRAISSILAAGFVVAGIGLMIGGKEVILALLWMSLIRVVESFSDIVYGLYQRHQKLHLMAISMTAAGIGLVVAAFLAVSLQYSITGILVAMLVSRVLIFVMFDLYQWRTRWSTGSGSGQWLAPTLKILTPIVRRSWPLGIVALLVSLNTNIPRYFVEVLLGTEMLGVFAALAYVPIAGYLVVGTMGQTMMPEIAKLSAQGDAKGVGRTAFQLCGFGAISGIVAVLLGIFVGEAFLRLAYGETFAQHIGLFILLLAAGGVSYVVVGAVYVLTALGRFKSQIIIYSLDFVMVSLLCILLIPQFGMGGVGVAILSSQFIQVTISIAMLVPILRKLASANTRQDKLACAP